MRLLTSCPACDNSVYDGKALPQPYKAPAYTGPEPTAEVENGRICKHDWHRHVLHRLSLPLRRSAADRPRSVPPKDHGSCHCGAVTLAVKVKPLETWDISIDEERIVECNCSICVRVRTQIRKQPPSIWKGSFIGFID